VSERYEVVIVGFGPAGESHSYGQSFSSVQGGARSCVRPGAVVEGVPVADRPVGVSRRSLGEAPAGASGKKS
jgi:hypothetical protein